MSILFAALRPLFHECLTETGKSMGDRGALRIHGFCSLNRLGTTKTTPVDLLFRDSDLFRAPVNSAGQKKTEENEKNPIDRMKRSRVLHRPIRSPISPKNREETIVPKEKNFKKIHETEIENPDNKNSKRRSWKRSKEKWKMFQNFSALRGK